MLNSDEMNVYFDIDLDFFSLGNPLNGRGKKYTYLKDTEIRDMLSPQRPLISWIFQRLLGFTIALEPEHTGGFLKSQKLLALLDSIYFKPSIGTETPGNPKGYPKWKHLQ